MSVARSRPAPGADHAAYDRDLYSWTFEQAALLRAGRFAELDVANIAEELETLGRSEFDKLASFYSLILLHMLKWEHQPHRQVRSWAISIDLHRQHATEVLDDNPGLKPRLAEALQRAYKGARLKAANETKLPKKTFPETCPFTLEEMMNAPYPWT